MDLMIHINDHTDTKTASVAAEQACTTRTCLTRALIVPVHCVRMAEVAHAKK